MKKRRAVLSNTTLERLHEIHSKLGDGIFLRTFNDFMIMEGLSPDIPIGISPGMVKPNKLWEPGVLYTQYDAWERYIPQLWECIDTTNFGEFILSRN